MSTSQPIYAIKDRAPEFPCWLFGENTRHWHYFLENQAGTINLASWKYWSPDADCSPGIIPTPSLPASPELPESARQAIPTAVSEAVKVAVCYAPQLNDLPAGHLKPLIERILAALTPLWPSAPTASPVAGLPTPEKGALEFDEAHMWSLREQGATGLDRSPGNESCEWAYDYIMQSERRLAAARAEVERLNEANRDYQEAFSTRNAAGLPLKKVEVSGADIEKANQELTDLRAQLATANAEAERYRLAGLQESDRLLTALDDLAKANAAVKEYRGDINGLMEECAKEITLSNDFPWAEEVHCAFHSLRNRLVQTERERDEACQVIKDLQLGPPGAKPISPELKAHLNEMNEAVYEQASQKGNLERRSSVPPEARAVEAAKIAYADICDYQQAEGGVGDSEMKRIIAAAIQRTCFPQSESDRFAEVKADVEKAHRIVEERWAGKSAQAAAGDAEWAMRAGEATDLKRLIEDTIYFRNKRVSGEPQSDRGLHQFEREEADEIFTVVQGWLAKHGLGVSEDTARIDLLLAENKRKNALPGNHYYPETRDGWDAAMQQGGKTP